MSYSYDRAGNLTQAGCGSTTWVYGYDALNRLRSVRCNGTLIARYGYDVLGRRIAKRVYSSSTGGTVAYTRFVYHGAHVAFETDSLGTMGLRYTYGLATDDVLAIRDAAGNHYYVMQDPLHSVRGLVRRDGTWVRSLRYGPYGVVIDSAGAGGPALRYRWTGRESDSETGWYFFRARYYDPAVRRFVQEDPIGYGGGVNVYAYAGGGPLEARDPSGLIMSPDQYATPRLDEFLRGGGGGPAVYIDGAFVGTGGGAYGLVDGLQGTSVFLDPHHPATSTQFERREAAIAYYNALGAAEASYEAIAEAPYYVPKSGEEAAFLIDSKDYVIDKDGWYKQTARFSESHIFSTVFNTRTYFVNVWETKPWGDTRFFLALDPAYISARDVAWYSGLMELVESNHRWFHVDLRVYNGRWASVYVGLEATGVGPRF